MSFLQDALENFQQITKKPEVFLGDDAIKPAIKSLLKTTYDHTKKEETSFKSNALPELITASFDLEQIWQQIELQNDAFLTHALIDVSRFVAGKARLLQEVHHEDESSAPAAPQDLDDANSNSSDDTDDDNESLNIQLDSDEEAALNSDDLEMDAEEEEEKPRRKIKPSIVDDQFFKLDEMEQFLQAAEKEDQDPDSGNDSEEDEQAEGEEEEEDIDYFKDDLKLERTDTERGGLNNPKYKDFFGKQDDGKMPAKGQKRNKFLDELDDEEEQEEEDEEKEDEKESEPIEEEEPEELKSSLEQREERLKRKITDLEATAISDKPWQLKGEIRGDARPLNSLLEEVVEFDLSTRPAPVMTEQTSLQLEDIIRQRIKDKVFDSVERKEKPSETPVEYRKKLVLNQEKSKQSLAQIYENEYLQQAAAAAPDAGEREEEEPAAHKEIRAMMSGLFAKLDALSNYHFTPKPAQAELRVVSNLPALSMEEVAPVATTDATLLAPEEVRGKSRSDALGKGERTATDKKRERRKKKAKQHHHAIIKVRKSAAGAGMGMGNKYSKAKAEKMLEAVSKSRNVDRMDESVGKKAVKSSTAFFQQLDDEVRSHIKNKGVAVKKKQKVSGLDAKKFKL